jgi:hypothetical protein
MKRHAAEMAAKVEEQICAASCPCSMLHVSCHLPVFGSKNYLVLIHHTRQTWHPVISGCSQKLNWWGKETVLTRFQRWKLQQNMISRVASEDWQDHWNKCIDSKGDYFEGD